MAACLDMNRGHNSDIEGGKREAGVITLQVIARGLDTAMAILLKGALASRKLQRHLAHLILIHPGGGRDATDRQGRRKNIWNKPKGRGFYLSRWMPNPEAVASATGMLVW